MSLYAFYVVRGYSLDKLANLSYVEKVFLHHARNKFYADENQKYKALFGGGE